MKLWKVLFTGSRDWTDIDPVYAAIVEEAQYATANGMTLVVLHGGYRGLDEVTENLCDKLGIHSAIFRARWKALSYKAGPQRNGVMVAFEPQKVRAFPLAESKGTIDCMEQARAQGIEVQEFAA